MKTFGVCGLFIFFASAIFAQRHGVGTTAGTNAGYGNVVFPGGRPAITTPFTQTNTNFATSLGNVVAGRPAFNSNGHRNGRTGAVVYVPYAYPVYGGAYYGGYYAGYGDGSMPPPQQPPQNITIIYPPQQQPVPMMMVAPQPQAQAPGGQIREYPQPDAAPSDSTQAQPAEPTYYLLAFKDHSIYSAVGYWVDTDTLHYITTGNVHNQVSLSLVDRDLTMQLNKGRGVQVNLPLR